MIRKAIIVMLTLAALGAGVLWGVSGRSAAYGPIDYHLQFEAYDHACLVSAWSGVASFHCSRCTACGGTRNCLLECPTQRYTFDFDLTWPLPTEAEWELGGIHWSILMLNRTRMYHLSVPIWMFWVAFAAYPTIAFIRGPLCRHRRRKRGLCVHCGYDLTGNVTGVCSECGEAIVKR